MGYTDNLLFLVRHYTSCTNIAGWHVDLIRSPCMKELWVLKEAGLEGDQFYLPVKDDGRMPKEMAVILARRYIEGERLPLWD